MNVQTSRRCEIENAKLLLVIALMPFILIVNALVCLTTKSRARIHRDGARRLAASLIRARRRAEYAFAEAQRRLDQRAKFALAMPVDGGEYPQAIPIAIIPPVQDTYTAQPVLSVYDTLPETGGMFVEEMQKPVGFSLKVNSGYLSSPGKRRDRVLSRRPFPLA